MSKEHIEYSINRMKHLDHVLDRIKESEEKRDKLSQIPYYKGLLDKSWDQGIFLKTTPRAIQGMKKVAESLWDDLQNVGEKDLANQVLFEHKVVKKDG